MTEGPTPFPRPSDRPARAAQGLEEPQPALEGRRSVDRPDETAFHIYLSPASVPCPGASLGMPDVRGQSRRQVRTNSNRNIPAFS